MPVRPDLAAGGGFSPQKEAAMRQKVLMITLALLLAMPLLVTSCGDDDDEGGTYPSNGDLTPPPSIANIELPEDIDFQNDDPIALQARAHALYALIPLVITIGQPIIVALRSATWTQGDGGCWLWSVTPEETACTFTYVPCKTDDGFDWSMSINGDYYGEEFDNWVAIRGTTSDDGTTGTLRWHQNHTTILASVWTWTTDADWTSGVLNVYDGEPAPETHSAMLQWTRHTDGFIDATYTSITNPRKLELHISAEGTAGWVKTYDWSEGFETFLIEKWISWENGSGFWNTYDEGTLVSEQTW
jgi:hypothetical protein